VRYREKRFCDNVDGVNFRVEGKYDIPMIYPEKWVPCEWISFNFCKTKDNRERYGVHFFIDDYQFERLWRKWKTYEELLKQFSAVMTPDFSIYTNYPVAVQIMNHYKKHFVGACLQNAGLRVYPTISWSDENSYEWCFDGEPVGGTVCVSSVGTQKNPVARKLFKRGYDAMCERLQPETIIFYGDVPKDCKGNIVRIVAFQEKFREVKTDDFT